MMVAKLITARSAAIRRRLGILLSVLVVLMLVADGMVDLIAPELLQSEMAAMGFSPSLATPLGYIILACAIVYAVPRTAFLGAIFVTGFLGGAICAHFRVGEIGSPPELVSIIIGVFAWGGLYLRDERIPKLLP